MMSFANSSPRNQLQENRSNTPIGYFKQLAAYKIEDDDDDDQNDSYSDIISLSPKKTSNDETEREEENPIQLVLQREAYCFDVKLFAEKFVEAIFIEANKKLMKNSVVTDSNIFASQTNKKIDPTDQKKTSEKHFGGVKFRDPLNKTLSYWPKISEFNIKVGLDKVEEYVQQWNHSDDWKFCVEFLGFECEDCSNIFLYEVEWSKPTMSYPIPQATASVYFALEVYKMVPQNYDRSIEVTYIFECSSLIHHPGRIDFQEKWLEDIIEAKLKFFKTITFSEGLRLSMARSFDLLKNEQDVTNEYIFIFVSK